MASVSVVLICFAKLDNLTLQCFKWFFLVKLSLGLILEGSPRVWAGRHAHGGLTCESNDTNQSTLSFRSRRSG